MKWGDQQKKYLTDNYFTMQTRHIAEHLGCTTKAVYRAVDRIGLSRPGAVKTPRPKPGSRERRRIPDHVREMLGGELY